MGEEQLIRCVDEGAGPRFGHGHEGALQLARITDFYGPQLDAEQLGGALRLLPDSVVCRVAWVSQDGDPRNARERLSQ